MLADISEELLVELAFFAPQWLDLVEQRLDWPGFRTAYYYFIAHAVYFILVIVLKEMTLTVIDLIQLFLHFRTKLIKDFFSEAMKNDQGEDVSTREIKQILQHIIAKEDKSKPLPDDELAQLLKEKGYPIARRTIAKYREQLDIPVARLRKEL